MIKNITRSFSNGLYDDFLGMDDFLKDQTWISLLNTLSWTLSVPIVHKLQGIHWSTAYISFSLLLYMSAGMFVHMFKGVKLKALYKVMMILNMLYFFSLFIYFYDVDLFLYIEVMLGLCHALYGPLLRISYELHVINKYEDKTFEMFKYIEQFSGSLGGVLGYGLVGSVSMFLDMPGTIKVFMFMMLIMLISQQYNWHKHFKNIG